jgi:hypothetical protein
MAFVCGHARYAMARDMGVTCANKILRTTITWVVKAHDLYGILHRICTACHFACTAWVCVLSPYTPPCGTPHCACGAQAVHVARFR